MRSSAEYLVIGDREWDGVLTGWDTSCSIKVPLHSLNQHETGQCLLFSGDPVGSVGCKPGDQVGFHLCRRACRVFGAHNLLLYVVEYTVN